MYLSMCELSSKVTWEHNYNYNIELCKEVKAAIIANINFKVFKAFITH